MDGTGLPQGMRPKNFFMPIRGVRTNGMIRKVGGMTVARRIRSRCCARAAIGHAQELSTQTPRDP